LIFIYPVAINTIGLLNSIPGLFLICFEDAEFSDSVNY